MRDSELGIAGQQKYRGAEVGAKVAKPGSRQQRVTGRVGRRVAVGMSRQSGLTGPLEPGQVQRPPSLERMHIDPKPNPRHSVHRSRLPA